MERFCTHDRLKEMAHTLDTNMNKAFNQICTWFAPKNKVFAGSGSLHNHIAFAVGINSLGVEVFFKRLLKKLGIAISDNVAYYLQLKEKNRVKRLAKVKTREAKVNKNKRKHDKMAEHTKVAKKERHKREGTYRRGMNLDDPIGDEDGGEKATEKNTKRTLFCEYCGLSGHSTKRSKKCTAKDSVVRRFNKQDGKLLSANRNAPGADAEPEALTAEALLAREDCDAMDSLPFDAEYDSEPDTLLLSMMLEDGADSDDDSDGVHVVGGTL
jgi:hypothetical protein